MWSCVLGGLPEVVLNFKFRQNRLNGFREVAGRNLPFPIPKASGLQQLVLPRVQAVMRQTDGQTDVQSAVFNGAGSTS